MSDLNEPNKHNKYNWFQLNASNFPKLSISQEYTLSTAAVPLTHPSLRACLHSCFHGGRKLTPPLWLRLHPPRFSGSSAPTPLLLSQYMCSPSRSLWPIDRPLLKSPCVAVVHLPEVTPAMEFFYFPLRCASQQAASNCYIFSWQEETAHITSRDVAWKWSAGDVVRWQSIGERESFHLGLWSLWIDRKYFYSKLPFPYRLIFELCLYRLNDPLFHSTLCGGVARCIVPFVPAFSPPSFASTVVCLCVPWFNRTFPGELSAFGGQTVHCGACVGNWSFGNNCLENRFW